MPVAAALARALPLPVRVRGWDASVAGPADGPTVVLRSPAALRHLLWAPGELGAARAYVSGEIDVEGDLGEALRRAHRAGGSLSPTRRARALATVVRLAGLGARPPVPAAEIRLHGRRHTRGRDVAVIRHHYNLSNSLYELLLEEPMAYSCAYWTSTAPGYTLADAQRDKLDLICRKLELGPGRRLLDVGCGWGALAVHAAQHYGATVTGITLSEAQLAFAKGRVADLGLGHLVDLRLADYRELRAETDRYDAVSAIEMGEHVGAGNYPLFLDTLHARLRPGGRLLVQQMSRGARHPGGGPFIERYIAADMHMRPVGETTALLAAGGFEVLDVQDLREHYVRTIRAWHERFEWRWADAVGLVGVEQARVWWLYLAGSALAFEAGRMGVEQVLARA